MLLITYITQIHSSSVKKRNFLPGRSLFNNKLSWSDKVLTELQKGVSMARPRKEGLDYFPIDVDIFEDLEVEYAKFGADGFTIYMYLLTRVYKRGYYLEVDEDFLLVMAARLRMSEQKVMQVLNYLLKRSLFDNTLFQSVKVLTSAGIQERFQLAVKSRALKNPVQVREDLWLLKKEETEPFIKVNPFLNKSKNNSSFSENNSNKSENNATKESKVNKYIYIASQEKPPVKESTSSSDTKIRYFDNQEVEDAFLLFISYKKQKGAIINPSQIELYKERLCEIAQTDAEKIAVAKEATMRGWETFYPVRKTRGVKTQSKQPEAKKTKFCNFEQRKYNMSELESMLLKSN